MSPLYDTIGTSYSVTRCTDPHIAAQLHARLDGATRIVNIGAGTGSYEPEGVDLIAVEPSSGMIAQRGACAHEAVLASAEHLPFEANSFSHAMTVLSMHHWENRALAFDEINRVATDSFVAITWNPAAPPFWLTRDYFPEIYEMDLRIFPDAEELRDHFDEVEISPLMVPKACEDGFLAAFWKRPDAYLNHRVRQSISAFSKVEALEQGLSALKDDLASGAWTEKNRHILHGSSLDVGYILISAKIRRA